MLLLCAPYTPLKDCSPFFAQIPFTFKAHFKLTSSLCLPSQYLSVAFLFPRNNSYSIYVCTLTLSLKLHTAYIVNFARSPHPSGFSLSNKGKGIPGQLSSLYYSCFSFDFGQVRQLSWEDFFFFLLLASPPRARWKQISSI